MPKAAGPKAAEVNGPGDSVAELKTARRTGVDVRLSPRDRVSLYAAAPYLSNSSEEACRLEISFVTYFEDPAVAQSSPLLDFDEDFEVNWEPGLSDGPTSARFAVVDFNADTGHLAVPAEWDEPNQVLTSGGNHLSRESTNVLRQIAVSNGWGIGLLRREGSGTI